MSLNHEQRFVKRKDALRLVRGELLRRGMTLTEWADASGYHRATVYRAMHGTHLGKKAMAIRDRVSDELGVAL